MKIRTYSFIQHDSAQPTQPSIWIHAQQCTDFDTIQHRTQRADRTGLRRWRDHRTIWWMEESDQNRCVNIDHCSRMSLDRPFQASTFTGEQMASTHMESPSCRIHCKRNDLYTCTTVYNVHCTWSTTNHSRVIMGDSLVYPVCDVCHRICMVYWWCNIKESELGHSSLY